MSGKSKDDVWQELKTLTGNIYPEVTFGEKEILELNESLDTRNWPISLVHDQLYYVAASTATSWRDVVLFEWVNGEPVLYGYHPPSKEGYCNCSQFIEKMRWLQDKTIQEVNRNQLWVGRPLKNEKCPLPDHESVTATLNHTCFQYTMTNQMGQMFLHQYKGQDYLFASGSYPHAVLFKGLNDPKEYQLAAPPKLSASILKDRVPNPTYVTVPINIQVDWDRRVFNLGNTQKREYLDAPTANAVDAFWKDHQSEVIDLLLAHPMFAEIPGVEPQQMKEPFLKKAPQLSAHLTKWVQDVVQDHVREQPECQKKLQEMGLEPVTHPRASLGVGDLRGYSMGCHVKEKKEEESSTEWFQKVMFPASK